MKVVGSPDEFKRFVPSNWKKNAPERKEAAEYYLSHGGILKLGDVIVKPGWPELIYPPLEVIEKSLAENDTRSQAAKANIDKWMRQKAEIESYRAASKVQKITSPLYWEHKTKIATDESYRKAFETINPPLYLFNKPEWQKRLTMFVRDPEYRARLLEAKTSKIGKKRMDMTEQLNMTLDHKAKLVDDELKRLSAKLNALAKMRAALLVLKDWEKETREIIRPSKKALPQGKSKRPRAKPAARR